MSNQHTALNQHTTLIESSVPGPSIKLCDVSLKSGEQTLLDAINVNFEAGRWHGIIGPNGSGKSTLIKTIMGMNKHTGTIQLSWPHGRSGNIGYIPQLVPFDASLPISVRDYLLMSLSDKPLWFGRRLPKSAFEALDVIGMADKTERKLGDLSGGERQRLMLTTALLQKPGLLILDEPMTGLDEAGRAQSLTILERFKQAGGTLLMIEHDWHLVQQYCDVIHWINKTLTPAQLGHQPKLSEPALSPIFQEQA